MVTIIINGKKKQEFQNMAQALAFAYQNGECYGAEKIELLNTAEKKAEKPEKEQENNPVKEEVVNPATGGGGSTETLKLEQMSRKELIEYAKKLNVQTGVIGFMGMKDADIIAAIREAEEKLSEAELQKNGGSEQTENKKLLEEMTHEELEAYAGTLNITTETIMSFVNDADLIAAIKIKEAEAANGGGGGSTETV